jgi:hypothetical protein
MTLTTNGDGTTIIEGPVVDQAVLHGLLNKLGDMGLPLVSVTPSGADQSKSPPPNHDNNAHFGD